MQNQSQVACKVWPCCNKTLLAKSGRAKTAASCLLRNSRKKVMGILRGGNALFLDLLLVNWGANLFLFLEIH